MNKQCNFCGASNFRERTVEYVYRRDGQYLIVSEVPCEECLSCGERYYEAETLKKIERDFDQIHSQEKKPQREVMVPIEPFSSL